MVKRSAEIPGNIEDEDVYQLKALFLYSSYYQRVVHELISVLGENRASR
jgi:hypothetical protein